MKVIHKKYAVIFAVYMTSWGLLSRLLVDPLIVWFFNIDTLEEWKWMLIRILVCIPLAIALRIDFKKRGYLIEYKD